MKKTYTLVILAAGMGNRFGGLKQVVPVGRHGEALLDFSVYDAIKAGFNKIVYIIKPEMQEDFARLIADKVAIAHRGAVDIFIAHQKMDDLPSGFTLPEGRTKPWGTAHAIHAAREVLTEPFAVINADDYYGPQVYKDFIEHMQTLDPNSADFAMAGYHIGATLSPTGAVTRGICTVEGGFLTDIKETSGIYVEGGKIYYDEGGKKVELSEDTPVSMNAFVFTPSIVPFIVNGLAKFLENNVNNPSSEYYLPVAVGDMLADKAATMRVIPAKEQWYGFTFKEDKEPVVESISKMIEAGLYPERLFNLPK